MAFGAEDANEIESARISMMARDTNVPFKGRIQKRKTRHLQIITFGLQRAAGPYRFARSPQGPLIAGVRILPIPSRYGLVAAARLFSPVLRTS